MEKVSASPSSDGHDRPRVRPRVAAALWLAAWVGFALIAGCAETGEDTAATPPQSNTLDRPPAPSSLPAPLDTPTEASDDEASDEKMDKSLGRLVFYRPREPLLIGLTPPIVVNGQVVGEAAMGEAFVRAARPGFYQIHLAGEEDDAIFVNVGPGETAYVRTAMAWQLLGYALEAELVDPQTGARESAETQRVGDDAKDADQ